jgi:hypothetical protein
LTPVVSSAFRVLLAALLGVTLLGRGLQWFNDYLDSAWHMGPTAASAAPAPKPVPVPQPAPVLPAATAAEISSLTLGALAERWKALEVLERRGPSPALIAALDSALTFDPTTQFHTNVVCLRARLSGDDVVAFVSRHLPAVERGNQSEPGRLTSCLVHALSRSDTTALEARDMLMRFLFSLTYERRQAALAAMKRWTFDALPREVRDRLFSPREHDRRAALDAAAALGAIAFQPEVFARALADREASVRSAAKAHLCRAGTPVAARLLASAVLDQPDGQRLLGMIGYDFKPREEIWKAFMAIGSDEAEPEQKRARAIELVGLRGDRQQGPELEALAQASSDLVRAAALAASAEHRLRHPS